VAGVVPADVQAVRVRLGGGAAPVVATVPDIAGYGGRYAGAVRFFSLLVPAPRRALGADLLGAGGRRIDRLPGPDAAPARTAPATVIRTRGLRLAVSPPPLSGCVQIDRIACAGAGDVAVVADCTPRRLVVAALLRAGATGLDVRLAGGRTVRAEIVRVRAPDGRRRRVALAILPARATPVEVVLRGHTPRRRALRAPAAAEQCGYADTVSLTAPR
jgi:hypothetical protein